MYELMYELRLEDIAYILIALIGAFAIWFVGTALYALWPSPWREIKALARGLFRRYFVVRVNLFGDDPTEDAHPVMSNGRRDQAPTQPVDNCVDSIATPVDNPIVNAALTVDSAEARDIIRFQAKVEALAALINADISLNQARAIEAVFGCSRTPASRPDSIYQRTLTALRPLLRKDAPADASPDQPQYRPLGPDRKPVLTE